MASPQTGRAHLPPRSPSSVPCTALGSACLACLLLIAPYEGGGYQAHSQMGELRPKEVATRLSSRGHEVAGLDSGPGRSSCTASATLCVGEWVRGGEERAVHPQGWHVASSPATPGLSFASLLCFPMTVDGGGREPQTLVPSSPLPLGKGQGVPQLPLSVPTHWGHGLPVDPPARALLAAGLCAAGALALSRIDLAFEEDNSR